MTISMFDNKSENINIGMLVFKRIPIKEINSYIFGECNLL
jgi:hypothetical protein